MNLSAKISAAIIGITLVVGGTVGYIAYTVDSGQAQKSVGNAQLNVAASTLNTIDRLLSDSYSNIQVLARLKRGEDYLLKPDENLAMLYRGNLDDISSIYGIWHALLLFDNSGELVISAPHDLRENVSISETPESELFKKALAGQVVYSDFYISKLTGEPVIAFAAPVRNSAGGKEVIGVVMGLVDWNIIKEILASTKLETHLLDREGRDIEVLGDEKIDEFKASDFFSSADRRPGTIQVYDENERENVLLSYVFESGFLDYKGNEWALVLERSAPDAFADARNNAWLIVGVLSIGGVLIAMLAILFFQRFIVIPIRELTEVSKNIAAGNLNQVIPVRSRDEIGKLATAFNTMAASLQELYSGMEKKVSEKTALLQTKLAELEKINKLMVDREIRMIELKKEIEELKTRQS
jgi:HAMP domain-containing protein